MANMHLSVGVNHRVALKPDSMVNSLAAGMLLFAFLLVMGCGDGGPTRASVHGTVTWDGKPIGDGMISFIPENGGPEATADIVGGKYELPNKLGPVVGNNRIAVLGIRNLGMQEAGPPHPPGTMVEATEQYIPNEYNNSSQLSIEIQKGDNTYDLALPKP